MGSGPSAAEIAARDARRPEANMYGPGVAVPVKDALPFGGPIGVGGLLDAVSPPRVRRTPMAQYVIQGNINSFVNVLTRYGETRVSRTDCATEIQSLWVSISVLVESRFPTMLIIANGLLESLLKGL
jgi:hypothetical protein